jgi:dephospho-CoA kinase
MLRVGLTGGLGSGKSTVASFLRSLGAEVVEADALGRQMMEPGNPVFDQIVREFGKEVLGPDGRLNRAHLAQLAFQGGRIQELNAIIHPAVIAAQSRWMEEVFARNPAAIAVVESALIFEVMRDAQARGEREGLLADWRSRFDRVILVTAPDHLKIARYVGRIADRSAVDDLAWKALEADASRRLAHQIPDAEKAAGSDYILDNNGDREALREQVFTLWQQLQAESNNSHNNLSLK